MCLTGFPEGLGETQTERSEERTAMLLDGFTSPNAAGELRQVQSVEPVQIGGCVSVDEFRDRRSDFRFQQFRRVFKQFRVIAKNGNPVFDLDAASIHFRMGESNNVGHRGTENFRALGDKETGITAEPQTGSCHTAWINFSCLLRRAILTHGILTPTSIRSNDDLSSMGRRAGLTNQTLAVH